MLQPIETIELADVRGGIGALLGAIGPALSGVGGILNGVASIKQANTQRKALEMQGAGGGGGAAAGGGGGPGGAPPPGAVAAPGMGGDQVSVSVSINGVAQR
jgi:hypothetical protein